VKIQAEVRDAAAVRAACQRLGLPAPVPGTTKLFSGEATGWAVALPGWRFPVVCDTDTGQIRYDNYSGRWGERKHLDALLQSYAIEKCRIESRKRGHTLTEQTLPDGSVKLTVQVKGGAA
jgi:hypothetical protein